jgi:hypothetical protein
VLCSLEGEASSARAEVKVLTQQNKDHAQHTAKLQKVINESQQNNNKIATELKDAKTKIIR